MKNVGRGSAFSIVDYWERELIDHRGNTIRFARDNDAVTVLHPNQSLSKGTDVPMAGTLSYGHEAVRTHYELQQIPKKLDEIKNEIRKLAQR